MARPSKRQLKERKDAARRTRRLARKASVQSDVVCERCGFAQPYVLGSRCLRGAALGPELECDGQMCVTLEAFAEATET